METNDSTGEESVMEALHQEFVSALKHPRAKAATGWLQKHKISMQRAHAGYIPEKFNHGSVSAKRKDMAEKAGMLSPFSVSGSKSLFGRNSMVFPLRNKSGDLVNFYAIEIETGEKKHLNEQGLYPQYPGIETEITFITQNIVDAATILECNILKENEAVLALHDGKWTKHHLEAIKALKNLKEVIIIEK